MKAAVPKYAFKKIEKKWQKKWSEDKLYQPDMERAEKPFYNLMMFPYPSAEGLHVGSVFTFSGVDTYGRFKKLQGYDVFEPIGLDGFGIHSENYAMKIGEHIKDVSKRTEKNFYRQLHDIGNMFDWSRTVETYKPEYYKWTQWLFLQMYKQGLAYRKLAKVNWCPSCKTVLSDEQVIAGHCERCDTEVIKKELNQWFFKITDYADRLLKNLDWIDWPEDVKTNQRNWIGKSEGAHIKFKIRNSKFEISVFTTRPDTLFGATYLVVAPENELILKLKSLISNFEEVHQYVESSIKKSEQERKAEEKEKTGVELKGLKAINPATGGEIPIWVADYVLSGYGTGAIMAVPAHDERDWEFAKKFNLPIVEVLKKLQKDVAKLEEKECFSGEGIAINSGFLDGLKTAEAKTRMIDWLEENSVGKKATDYKLRDWCISRQRYWGPPIPIVWCDGKCKMENVKSKNIKVLIIHGFEGNGDGNWFPWMKNNLEKLGCEVFTPTMSTSHHPDLQSWMNELQPYLDQLDENSIVIGHSLGSKAALHLLAQGGKKVGKLFLVASAIGNPKRNWAWLKKVWANSDLDALKKFWEQPIDWKSADQFASKKYIIVSKDDPFIDSEHYKTAALNDLQVEVWNGQGHFCQTENQKLYDYILKEILKDMEAVPVPVPQEQLPVKLPPMEDFLPEGQGKGPLAKNKKFVNAQCPVCGGKAERETDVSDPFVDSSWYFFRYPSTDISDQPFDKKRTQKWLPVDSYIGGKEHTVLHLLYSRFVTMVLKDLGHIDFEEPYKRFFGHGLITKDGAKMSKSKGNVVNPDEMIAKYGADTVRLYLRFVGDFAQGGDWRDTGVEGMQRFVNRMWKLFHDLSGQGAGVSRMNMVDKTVKTVGEDYERLSFNTAVARVMEFVNWAREHQADFLFEQAKIVKETLAFLIAPMAPHLAEEFWQSLGHEDSIFVNQWPVFNAANLLEDEVEVVVQVNGKVRDKLPLAVNLGEEEAKAVILKREKIKILIQGKEIKKVIYIPGRIMNIVVG